MSSFKSLEEVSTQVQGAQCYLDPAESDYNADKSDTFIIYDQDGDVLYRYLKDKKCFYQNSPAYKNKRVKRNIHDLVPFTSEEQFTWTMNWNNPSKS